MKRDMKDIKALVITPVKDSVSTTIEVAKSIASSNCDIQHIIFDDFSTEETVEVLRNNKESLNFELIRLNELTNHPSPNYKLVLEIAQKKAVEMSLPLIVIESDVIIKENTINNLLSHLNKFPNAGLIGCVTTDENENINFPYLKFSKEKREIICTNRSISFCCTLISPKLLSTFSFKDLNDKKDWFDVFLSHKSIELGFQNWLLLNSPVLHKPHGSRPWKKLKYTNPLKYYFNKYLKGLDKI